MKFTSEFIFTLVEKYKVPLDNSSPREFSDENYYGFCNEYVEQCKARDISLKRHLTQKPNLFRTFLPWRDYVFDTVFQLQWYYDELIIYDPIYFEIKYFISDNLEKDKSNLRQLVSFLNSLKESISEGFLLFGSYDAFASSNPLLEENKFESLLEIQEVRDECDKLVQVFKMEASRNIAKDYYNIRSYYRNSQNLFSVVKDKEKIKNKKGITAVWFDLVGSTYTPLSIEEVRKEGIYDRVYGAFRDQYPIEIKEILKNIEIGSYIKTPVLFNRRLDEIVLSNISSSSPALSSKANDYYKLILPFVNGIPPERLFEVRTKMPLAFLDFRSLMFEIIYDFEKNGVEADILEVKVQQKINPILRKLDAEMKNSLTKAKILGAGLPIISGMGALGLWHFGVDIPKYSALLLGGLNVAGLNALSNYLSEKRMGQTNSLYYLWKIRQ